MKTPNTLWKQTWAHEFSKTPPPPRPLLNCHLLREASPGLSGPPCYPCSWHWVALWLSPSHGGPLLCVYVPFWATPTSHIGLCAPQGRDYICLSPLPSYPHENAGDSVYFQCLEGSNWSPFYLAPANQLGWLEGLKLLPSTSYFPPRPLESLYIT